jgi:hypothetical protein
MRILTMGLWNRRYGCNAKAARVSRSVERSSDYDVLEEISALACEARASVSMTSPLHLG